MTSEVLIVDDDAMLRRAVSAFLNEAGFGVVDCATADEALAMLEEGRSFGVIVTDLAMPGLSAMTFLQRVREHDLDVPIVILTGNPSLESAIAVMEYGAFRYLRKPIGGEQLTRTVAEAASMHRLALLKRRALELQQGDTWPIGDRAGLEARFDRALDRLWLAFQPIVDCPRRRIFAHEALVRSSEPPLSEPSQLFEAADRLGRVHDLGRRIRRQLAQVLENTPGDVVVFANLHPLDLADHDLYGTSAALSRQARRVVLEITERSSLHQVKDLRDRIRALRDLGYRIAVDDLGAGYAGLSSFSQLEPEIVKLDMSLVRGIDTSPRKASLVRSIVTVCTNELGTQVVSEGVETEAERDTLLELGANLLQGYLFASPDTRFRGSSVFVAPPVPES
jgi:EAL domain-containing protein (putative c-di-GMP-specific phosphodiesterase class I)